jgi:hypothetical protein
MRPPLKLSAIDQEHLQELYNAAGVARDELPYTPAYDGICQGFQDRTFKNAHPEQVFLALMKYVRSGTNSAGLVTPTALSEEQLKKLKELMPRHTKGGKLIPYSDEFESLQKEFIKHVQVDLTALDFWRAVMQAHGPKRRPPKRTKVPAAPVEDDDSDIE